MIQFLKIFHSLNKFILILLFCLIGARAFAERSGLPLFFPADKNKIQILPQRFEYSMKDAEKIKIGDVIVDTSQLNFEILVSKKSKNIAIKYRFKFSWPADLLQNGNIYLTNNNGKAVWSSTVNARNTTYTRIKNTDEPDLRSSVAHLLSDEINPETFNSLKYFPFMKFCINKYAADTRIETCSKELYFFSEPQGYSIKSRPTNIREASVSINARPVGDQGMVFLNDVSESISFRATVISGATLTIETRKKDVEFKNVFLGDDQKSIVFEAHGTEPVLEKDTERLTNGNWRTSLPIDRPVVYLQGQGEIPLRQEFFIKGPVPRLNAQAFIKEMTAEKTYNSKLKTTISASQGTKLSNIKNESSLQSKSETEYIWMQDQLETGQSNRHYLNLSAEKENWIAAFDIFRGCSSEVAVQFFNIYPSAYLNGAVQFSYWFENFLGLNTKLSHQKWGLGISHISSVVKKSNLPQLIMTNVDLSYRFSSGLNYIDPSMGIKIISSQIKLDSTQTTSLGVGLFDRALAPQWLPRYFTWMTLNLDYFLPASTVDFDFKGLIKTQGVLEMNFNSVYFLDAGLSLEKWNVPVETNISAFQFGLNIGAKYIF